MRCLGQLLPRARRGEGGSGSWNVERALFAERAPLVRGHCCRGGRVENIDPPPPSLDRSPLGPQDQVRLKSRGQEPVFQVGIPGQGEWIRGAIGPTGLPSVMNSLSGDTASPPRAGGGGGGVPARCPKQGSGKTSDLVSRQDSILQNQLETDVSPFYRRKSRGPRRQSRWHKLQGASPHREDRTFVV